MPSTTKLLENGVQDISGPGPEGQAQAIRGRMFMEFGLMPLWEELLAQLPP